MRICHTWDQIITLKTNICQYPVTGEYSCYFDMIKEVKKLLNFWEAETQQAFVIHAYIFLFSCYNADLENRNRNSEEHFGSIFSSLFLICYSFF